MKSPFIQTLMASGFKETTYPEQEGIFYSKKLLVALIPVFSKDYVDDEVLCDTDEAIVELCPDDTVQVVCINSDFKQSFSAESVDGMVLIAEASAVQVSSVGDTSIPVTLRVVEDEDERMEFLPKHFGKLFDKYQQLLYHLMEKFVPTYVGGYWDFIELSNGGVYARLEDDNLLEVHSPNGTVVSMSADGASLVVNTFLQGLIAKETENRRYINMYHSLRAYAARHHADSAGFCAVTR